MHPEIAAILSEIGYKVNALKEKLEAVENENTELKNQLLALKVKNKELIEEMDEKDKKIKLLKLARKMAGDNTDTQGVKRQINELVNEIDRCMALLNG